MADKDLTQEEIEANLELVRHIPAWLRHKKVTQAHLAEQLDVSTGSVSKWLRGLQSVSSGQIFLIARLLDVEARRLMFDPDDIMQTDEHGEISEILKRLSPEDRRRWVEFGRNLAESRHSGTD